MVLRQSPWAQEAGIQQFVYTHKENATSLADLDILDYFTEIVATANGFARKPDPEGVLDYLVEELISWSKNDLLYR